MADPIVLGIASSTIILLISLFIMWDYFKNQARLALYFGLFLLFFSMQGLFRIFGLLSGDATLFFLHKASLALGPVVIIHGISRTGVQWLKKYWVAPAIALVSILLVYYDVFIFGGFAVTHANTLTGYLTAFIGGAGLLVAGYYFYLAGRNIPTLAKALLDLGVVLHGFLYLLSPWISGDVELSFYMGTFFSMMILGGWLFSIEEYSEKFAIQEE